MMFQVGQVRGRVELSPTGWRVEWLGSVNEMVFNRRKRRRYKKAIRAMSQEQLLELLSQICDHEDKRVAEKQETIFGSLIR